MHTILYFGAWLLVAVLAAAGISWLLARHTRRHDQRSQQARRLVQSLEDYSTWVCAQRLATVFQGEDAQAAEALDAACTTRMAWFPELSGEMAEVLAVHNRLLHFLGAQQQLWLRDPEHWLESDHDKRFMALWRQHRFALEALLARLEQAASVRIQTSAPPGASTYA